MTYGDKYMELWKEYVNKQSEYFAELLPKSTRISSERLHEISNEVSAKRDLLVQFAAKMRAHSKSINDIYVAEPIGNPNEVSN